MAVYKKIPYGISNIERLIKDNYYYVDKSSKKKKPLPTA